MNTSQTTDLDHIIATYSPRVAAAFDLQAEDYEKNADGFTRLLEDAAEMFDEGDLSSENLLGATHHMDKAGRPDAAGERYRNYIAATLDEVLSGQESA